MAWWEVDWTGLAWLGLDYSLDAGAVPSSALPCCRLPVILCYNYMPLLLPATAFLAVAAATVLLLLQPGRPVHRCTC